jgi:hypothetical protein
LKMPFREVVCRDSDGSFLELIPGKNMSVLAGRIDYKCT